MNLARFQLTRVLSCANLVQILEEYKLVSYCLDLNSEEAAQMLLFPHSGLFYDHIYP
jgi:hypothetical protein